MPGQTPYQKEWIKNNPEKVALYKQRYKEKHGKELAKKRSLEYLTRNIMQKIKKS